jgi:PAS domain S-box-containing protein
MTERKATSEKILPSAEVQVLVQQLAESNAALTALKLAHSRIDSPEGSLSPKLLAQVQHSLAQSKELLEKLLSSMQVGVAYLDMQFDYVWVNPAFARQRKCSPDYLLGRNHLEFGPGSEDEQYIRAAIEKGESFFTRVETISFPAHSESRFLECSYQTVSDSVGVAGLIYTETDVTDRVRAGSMPDSEQIEESRQQAELMLALFDSDPAGLAILSDPDLVIQFANANFKSLLSTSPVDPLGKPLAEVLPEEDELYGLLASLTKQKEPVDLNRQERHFKDGSIRWFNYHIRPIHWKNQPAWIINTWDATDDHLARLHIEATAVEAQTRAEELKAVITAMSEAVTIYDKDGQPVMANPAVLQSYGFDPITTPRQEAIKKLRVCRSNGEVLSESELPSARALRGERVQNEQLLFLTGENSKRIILASASPLYNQGELMGAVTVWTDVTEREKLLRQIKSERSRLSTIIANAPVGIIAIDQEGELLISSSISTELLGLGDKYGNWLANRQNTATNTLFDPVHLARDAINGKTQVNQEIVLTNPNHELQYLLVNSAPIVDIKGNVEGAIAIFQDITSQKQAEQNLRDAKERFAVALKNSPIMVYKTDRDLRYTWIYNPHYGSSENMIGRLDDEIDGVQDVEQLMSFKRSVLAAGKGDRQEITVVLHGFQLIYDVTAEPLRDDQGEITGLTVAAVDITEQKRVKDEMTKNLARIEVQRHLIRQRELERQQIARDLHDGPLQELIGINFGLQEALDIPHRRQRRLIVDQIQSSLQELMQEMRAFCSELRPPALAPFGLEKAIRSHIELFEEKHPAMKIQMNLTEDQGQLTEEVRNALYRIYQELMNNIVKHAGANSVSVRFTLDASQAELEVSDNGKGFDIPNDWVETARSGHLGLVGIFERTDAVRGTISITSESGVGTNVLVIVPVQHEHDPNDPIQGSNIEEEI